jgi:hypothetical protein
MTRIRRNVILLKSWSIGSTQSSITVTGLEPGENFQVLHHPADADMEASGMQSPTRTSATIYRYRGRPDADDGREVRS